MSYNDSYFTALRNYVQGDLIEAVEVHTKDKVFCLTENSKVFFDFIEDKYKFTNVLIVNGNESDWQLDPVESISIKSEDIKSFAI